MSHSQLKVFLLTFALIPGLFNSRLTAEQNDQSSLQMLKSKHANGLRLLPYRDVSVPLIGEHADGKKSSRVRGSFISGDGRTLVFVLSGAKSTYATYDCVNHRFIAVRALPEGYLSECINCNSKIGYYGTANHDGSMIALIASDSGLSSRRIMLVDRNLNYIREITIHEKCETDESRLAGLLLSRDGKKLVTAFSALTGNRQQDLMVLETWDTSTGKLIQSARTDAQASDWHKGLHGMLFSSDESAIITYHGDAGVCVYDATSLKLMNRKGNAPVEWAAFSSDKKELLLTMPSLRKWSWPDLNVLDGKNWGTNYITTASHFLKKTALIWGHSSPSGVVTVMLDYNSYYNFASFNSGLLNNTSLTAGDELVICHGAFKRADYERTIKFINTTGIQPDECLVLPNEQFLKSHKGIHSFKMSTRGDILLNTMNSQLVTIHAESNAIQNLESWNATGYAFDAKGEQLAFVVGTDHTLAPAPSASSESELQDREMDLFSLNGYGTVKAFRFDPKLDSYLFAKNADALHPTLPYVAEIYRQDTIRIRRFGEEFLLSETRGHNSPKSVEFMPENEHFVILCRNSEVEVWNWQNGLKQSEYRRDLGNGINDHVDMSISPDGKYVAICWNGSLDILSLPDLNVAGRYYIASSSKNIGLLTAVQWSNDSSNLFVGDSEGRLATYSLKRLLKTDQEQNNEAKTTVTTN